MSIKFLFSSAAFIITTFLISQFFFYENKKKTALYMSEINRVNLLTDQDYSENNGQIKSWNDCIQLKEYSKCLRNLFYNETFKNGVEGMMLYLRYAENKYILNGKDCHFIAHGIGNASFEINKSNPVSAFSILSNSKYREVFNSCIQGYFHGVMEKYSYGATTKEALIRKYLNICKGLDIEDVRCLNLYKSHGLGHGVYIQLLSAVDSLSVCDNIFQNKFNQRSCYTGVFMEEISKEKDKHFEYRNDLYKSNYCEGFNKEYRPECYHEQVKVVSEKLVAEGRFYEENINICKDINNKEDRFSCVKHFSAYALTLRQPIDVIKLCNNTSSFYEKAICKASITHKLAFYLDPFKKGLDREIIINTCFQDGDIISGYFCKVLMEKTSNQLDVIRLEEVKDLIFKLPPFFDFI